MAVPQPETNGSTVRRILLGGQLRRHREAAGISRAEAGYAIRSSESKISRMELGRVSFKERDVVDLLALYGLDDGAERQDLIALAREANLPSWWHNYSDVMPSWFQVYVGLEGAASLIRTYDVQFVPELLQTADYARALTRRGQPSLAEEDVERRVGLRLSRQRVLGRSQPARLWAVIDEAALRRPIGGPHVHREQLQHLVLKSKEPNITLQVLPIRVGGHAETGTFAVLRFPEPDLSDLVYVEQLTGALYLDKPEDVDRYLEAMNRLSVDSEPPEQTTSILETILREG